MVDIEETSSSRTETTPRPWRWAGVLQLGFIAVLLTGCQTAYMPVSDELSTSVRMPVEGRQGWKIREHIRFGPYETYDIDRSWTKGRDRQVLILSGNKRKQQYAFTLREGRADQWTVSCEAALRKQTIETDLVDLELKNRSQLDCSLRSRVRPGEFWQMTLAEKRERPLSGTLSRGDMALEVRGTNKLQKGLPTTATTGYEVLQDGRVLGAVEVLNGGAVWLHRDLSSERRSVISAAAAALLLLEDLRGSLPDDVAAR